LVTALIREAREEVGIRIHPDEPRMAAVVHHRNPEGVGRIGFFFEVPSRSEAQGEPLNAEPSKCSRIAWTPLDCLPHDTYPYTAAGVDLYLRGVTFGLDGWGGQSPPVTSRGNRWNS